MMSLSDAGDNFENEGLCQPGNENTGECRHRLLVTQQAIRQSNQSVTAVSRFFFFAASLAGTGSLVA